jgi:hypothetical protein
MGPAAPFSPQRTAAHQEDPPLDPLMRPLYAAEGIPVSRGYPDGPAPMAPCCRRAGLGGVTNPSLFGRARGGSIPPTVPLVRGFTITKPHTGCKPNRLSAWRTHGHRHGAGGGDPGSVWFLPDAQKRNVSDRVTQDHPARRIRRGHGQAACRRAGGVRRAPGTTPESRAAPPRAASRRTARTLSRTCSRHSRTAASTAP